MKTTPRRSHDRGQFDFGWLKTFHSFSFGDYRDRDHMGFRSLRVINEDHVAPGRGFPTHPHQDMEIITYVIDGALAHEDSMGHGEVIRPGDVQRMTAGSGITHSEFNPSATEPTHLLQIWITPATRGLEPGYEQVSFSSADTQNQLRLIASRTGDDGAVLVHQDVEIFACHLDAGAAVTHRTSTDRGIWIQVIRGSIALTDGTVLEPGDAAAVEATSEVVIESRDDAEFLLFDLG